jgi:AIPR protein.
MGANDVLALEAHFRNYKENRFPALPGKDFDVFEYYCLDQLLRSLSDSQIKSGMVGGGNDGGVDGLYMLVNGELVDSEFEPDPKSVENVKILIIQAKTGEGFSPIGVDKLYWFADDLLDLTRKKADYHTAYRDELIALMRLIKDKYGVIIGEDPLLSVEFFYITKLDVKPNDNCQRSAEKIKGIVRTHFNNAQCGFHFVNAEALWKIVQMRPPKKRTLKWDSQPLSTQEGQIGLVKLNDYYDFLKEPDGRIAERIFDSNVRGYWPSADVNKKIAATLKKPTGSDFWLLNNGITILAERIELAENFLGVEITDPQIVNGLQTSRQIFNYYNDAKSFPDSDNRRVLLRIIKTSDTTIRDDVIRCTNSQNEMPQEALRATDPIHRKIETLFANYGLFYDRRKGHYKEQGMPVAQIVSLVDVLQAMLSVVLRRPDDARARPRNYFKSNDQYAQVFGKDKDNENDKYSLSLYLKSTQILRRIQDYLDEINEEAVHRRNLTAYLCTYATCAAASNAYAAPNEILKIDLSTLSSHFLADCYRRLKKRYEGLAERDAVDGDINYDVLAKGTSLLKAMNTDLKRRFNQKKVKEKSA